MKNDRVGVVVIGRNEGQRLVLCLESILGLDVPCVYVDSQSSDKSVGEADKRGVITVVLDDSSPINASRARNVGFEKIIECFPNIDYVHFIDADCELNENWLVDACQTLDGDNAVSIVVGRLHEKYRNQTIYMRLCDIDWYIKPGYTKKCGGIFTVRRQVYSELGGFDTSLIAGADPEFCHRLRQKGGKVLVRDADMGTHDSAMYQFSQWWRRATKVGYAYANGAQWSGRQAKSALLWGALIPLLILAVVLFLSHWFLLLFGVYAVQVARVYFSKIDIGTLDRYDRLVYALFCVLAKFPQAEGAMNYLINTWLGKKQKLIEYKGTK